MKFIPVVLSALFLATIWLASSASADRSPRQLRVPLPLPTPRTPPADRRKSPLFPKMGASFVVTERARKMAPPNKMAPSEAGKRRTNSLLPNLSLKQKVAGEGNVKRMTAVSPGVTGRPVVIRPSNLVKTSMTAGPLASRSPSSPPAQSTTKRPLMRPASQLMGGVRRGRTRDVTGASRPLIREKRLNVQPQSSPQTTRDMPSGLAYRD